MWTSYFLTALLREAVFTKLLKGKISLFSLKILITLLILPPGDLPNFVKENGGDVVISYGMGGRAVDFFNQLGIDVVIGASGTVREAVDAFLKGKLEVDEDWKSKEEFGHHESSH